LLVHYKTAREGKEKKIKTLRSRHFDHRTKYNTIYNTHTMHTRHLLIILWWTKTVGRPKKGGKDMRTPKSKPKKPPDSGGAQTH